MGSEFWKQPAKRIDREFRAMGAVRVERTSQNVAYRFPDGARRLVPTNISPGTAREILSAAQHKYGTGRTRDHIDPLRSAVQRPDSPTITPDRLRLSKHAGERFELMSGQEGLEPSELRDAVTYPEQVLWSPVHDSWMWVRGRVIVAICIGDDATCIIRTILWATEDLWERNPRPVES